MVQNELSKMIGQNIIDIRSLQTERTSGVEVLLVTPQDVGRFTDSISSKTGSVYDSAIANISRTNHELNRTNSQDWAEGLHRGTEVSSDSIQLSATPGGGSFLGPWETYCGSWINFYFSSTLPASTSIEVRIQDSSGTDNILRSGTSSPFAITGLGVYRQVRPVFLLTSSLGGNNPQLHDYQMTYSGARIGDQGVALI